MTPPEVVTRLARLLDDAADGEDRELVATLLVCYGALCCLWHATYPEAPVNATPTDLIDRALTGMMGEAATFLAEGEDVRSDFIADLVFRLEAVL